MFGAGLRNFVQDSKINLVQVGHLLLINHLLSQILERELAVMLGVDNITICDHLRQIEKVKKLEKWVPHELSEKKQKSAFIYLVIIVIKIPKRTIS
jgi:hypothetical protein